MSIEKRSAPHASAKGNRLPEVRPLDLSELKTLYGRDVRSAREGLSTMFSVPSHRFGFEHAQRTLNDGAADPASIESNVVEWTKADLSWQTAISLTLQTKLDVSYEQLEGLTLEGSSGDYRLVATMRLRRPVGYGGGVCTAGSREYIAFWADWDLTGTYTWAGTAELRVYDIARLPSEGILYRVTLPVEPDSILAARNKPWVARVRAVLSWGVPPSTKDPDALSTWGNSIDATVQVLPGRRVIPLLPRGDGIGSRPTGARQETPRPASGMSRASTPRRFSPSSSGIRLLAAH